MMVMQKVNVCIATVFTWLEIASCLKQNAKMKQDTKELWVLWETIVREYLHPTKNVVNTTGTEFDRSCNSLIY
jgi:hypothetical protein